MKSTRKFRITLLLGTGSILLQGCPPIGLVDVVLDECFGGDSISESAFNDLNAFEQLLYDENDCGRYESRSSFLTDLF